MPLINGSQLHDLRVEAYINEFNNTTNLPPARREKYIKDNFLSTTVPPNTIFTEDEMEAYLSGKRIIGLMRLLKMHISKIMR